MRTLWAILASVLGAWAAVEPAAQQLVVSEKTITVGSRPARVFQVLQPDGTPGVRGKIGERLVIDLHNQSSLPITLHPHGVILPSDQDGVPYVSQEPVPPGGRFRYDFVPKQAGTFYLHSHYGYELQNQLATPLILEDEKPDGRQEVILMLSDFTFQDPVEIFRKLRHPDTKMAMSKESSSAPDLNDVLYDAYLANGKTLEDPDVVEVAPGGKVLLRVINASSASNFFVSLGGLDGRLVAVDGEPVEPVAGQEFELAVAQRMDVEVSIPKEGGAFPILAQGEGRDLQTGLILATSGAERPAVSSRAPKTAGAIGVGYRQEKMLRPLNPLPKRAVTRTLPVVLGGKMDTYEWTLNGQLWPSASPFIVAENDRVEFVYKNETGMSHPMHLHGHKFQVTEIDGEPVNGAVRDTILVMPNSTVKVQFDADNPGLWMMHCHILWHEAGGMMGIVHYEGFPKPDFYLEKETFDLPSSLPQPVP